jgi:hypothetical protein
MDLHRLYRRRQLRRRHEERLDEQVERTDAGRRAGTTLAESVERDQRGREQDRQHLDVRPGLKVTTPFERPTSSRPVAFGSPSCVKSAKSWSGLGTPTPVRIGSFVNGPVQPVP